MPTATTDGHKLVVLQDRGSLVFELYAPISASEIGSAQTRSGTLLLTMRKMRAAEAWPSFECDGLDLWRTAPPPSQRMRKIRAMCSEQSVLGIADAVSASNEPLPKRRRVYVSVYILLGGLTSDALLSNLVGGGLYHSGIEIEGVEYAFGSGPGGGSGVWRQPPRALPPSFKNAAYKESLDMGMTRPLTPAELHRVIVDMEHEWRKNQYSMLTHNWCVARDAP